MKIFLDTANLDEIRKYNDMGLLDGITTNPSLLAKQGGNPHEVMEEITKEKVCAPEDILSPSKNNWMCIGTGWNKYHEKIKSKFTANITAIKADALPEARGVLELAKNSYQKGKFISADKISPVYLRDNVTKQQ